MKFFIATPWRNVDAVRGLAAALQAHGHAVRSFLDNGANVATGRPIEEESKEFAHSIVDWEDDPMIQRIFQSEIQALAESDAIILLEPSGRSSLAEAAIAYGLGKEVLLVGLVQDPEIVYLMCQHRYRSVEEFLSALDAVLVEATLEGRQ